MNEYSSVSIQWKLFFSIYCLYLLVVVAVVVAQTVGSISSKTLAYDCLCTIELCMESMIATSLLGHFGIFCPVFVQAVLDRVHCSAAYTSCRAFQVVVILIEN